MKKQGEVFKVNKTAKQLDSDVMELRAELLDVIADSGHNVGVAADALILAVVGVCEITCNRDFDGKVVARLREVADLLDAVNSQQ